MFIIRGAMELQSWFVLGLRTIPFLNSRPRAQLFPSFLLSFFPSFLLSFFLSFFLSLFLPLCWRYLEGCGDGGGQCVSQASWRRRLPDFMELQSCLWILWLGVGGVGLWGGEGVVNVLTRRCGKHSCVQMHHASCKSCRAGQS